MEKLLKLLFKPVILSLLVGSIFTIRAYFVDGIWSAYWSALLWAFITVVVLIVTVLREAAQDKHLKEKSEDNLVGEIHLKKGKEMIVLKKYRDD